MNRKGLVVIIFSIIIALAGVVRFYQLDSIPPGLNQDEAVNGIDALALSQTGKDHHSNSPGFMLESYGDWVSPLLTYLTIIPVKLLGLNIWSVRGTSALIGVLTVILMFFASQMTSRIVLKDKKIIGISSHSIMGLVAAALLALSPWHIHNSRWAVPSITLPMMVLGMYVVWLKIVVSHDAVRRDSNQTVRFKNRTVLWFCILGIVAGITCLSYPTAKLFVPLFLGAMVILYLVDPAKSLNIDMLRELFRNAWSHRFELVALAVTFLFFYIPIVLPSLLDGDKFNARFSEVSSLGHGVYSIAEVIFLYLSYFNPLFFFYLGDTDPMRMVPGTGALGLGLTVFLLIGLFGFVQILRKHKSLIKYIQERSEATKVVFLLVAWFFISPIPASLTQPGSHSFRVIHILPVLIIIVSFGAVYLVHTISRSAQVFITLYLLGSFLIFAQNYYGGEYSHSVRRHFQYGLEEAIIFAESKRDQYDKIIIDEEINTPYIYVLFYTQPSFSPLDYEIVRPSPGGWNKVHRVGMYYFKNVTSELPSGIDADAVIKIDEGEQAGLEEITCQANLLQEIDGGEKTSYSIYECTNQNILVIDRNEIGS